MKMHPISKSLGYRTSYRFCGAVFYVAAFSVTMVSLGRAQTKNITPDPYFRSSQTPSPIKKPSELTGSWNPPINLGAENSSASKSSKASIPTTADSNAFGFQPNSGVTKSPTPLKLPGFGTSPSQQSATASTSQGSTSKLPATTAFGSSNQSGVRTANAGSQSKNLPGASSQTPSKSLIVHANEQAAPQSSGSGSRQVDHREESASKAFKSGKVLALVGGDPIFVGDLMFQINQLIEEKMAAAPEEVKEKQRQMAIPQLLPQFVESKLLYQGALRGLPDGVDMEAIFTQVEKQFEETTMPKMMESANVKSVAEFDARLRGQDYSLRQLKRKWAIQQFTRHSIGQKLGKVPTTTHQEMLDRYKKNLASYEKPARAKWEQVVIRFDRTDSRTDAKRKIAKIGNQIIHGANFNATAKKHSHGFKAASGGQHDWTTQGALALDEIDEAIFSLPVGELSELIETKRGFHIVRVIERAEASRTPFLEAQIEIKKKIVGEKRKVLFDKYIAKLREEIPVEYLINE